MALGGQAGDASRTVSARRTSCCARTRSRSTDPAAATGMFGVYELNGDCAPVQRRRLDEDGVQATGWTPKAAFLAGAASGGAVEGHRPATRAERLDGRALARFEARAVK